MSEFIDRKTFCEEVGIHPATLSEWIRDGVVTPGVGRGWRQTFTEEDVRRGLAFEELRATHHGARSRRKLLEMLDGNRSEDARRHPPEETPPAAGATTDQ